MWCEDRGLTPATIRPHDVGTCIEQLQTQVSAPSVKQQLAAIRMLFNWLITGQIVPHNPASAVRGPKHVVKVGKTPVLEAEAWRKLLKSIPTENVRDLRDRTSVATLTYSHATRPLDKAGQMFARPRWSRLRLLGSFADILRT